MRTNLLADVGDLTVAPDPHSRDGARYVVSTLLATVSGKGRAFARSRPAWSTT